MLFWGCVIDIDKCSQTICKIHDEMLTSDGQQQVCVCVPLANLTAQTTKEWQGQFLCLLYFPRGLIVHHMKCGMPPLTDDPFPQGQLLCKEKQLCRGIQLPVIHQILSFSFLHQNVKKMLWLQRRRERRERKRDYKWIRNTTAHENTSAGWLEELAHGIQPKLKTCSYSMSVYTKGISQLSILNVSNEKHTLINPAVCMG